MSAHFDHVVRAISAEMIAAGLSADVAPTPARIAAERIVAGEPSNIVVQELLTEFGITPSTPTKAKAEPVEKPPAEKPRDHRAAERIRVGTLAGNPWAAGSINVTRQAMVTAADPALAARLRSEANP